MASPEGYPHVWARDSVITALGALLAPSHEECLKTSLLTLSGQQSELGAIPNNVSVATGRLDHTNAGSVDSNLWFIIGREYYRNNNLNIPEQYHNGGIWPFVGGFYVAALVKAGRMEEARRQLEKLAKVNRLGLEEEWEFNEWCHGRTGRPMGYPHQAWSAGMYLYPYHCVQLARVPLLQAEQTMAKGDLTLRTN